MIDMLVLFIILTSLSTQKLRFLLSSKTEIMNNKKNNNKNNQLVTTTVPQEKT